VIKASLIHCLDDAEKLKLLSPLYIIEKEGGGFDLL
jgi:hypothetical protein